MYPNQEVIRPHLRLATEKDCIYLADNLREDDYREIQATTGLPALLSLIHGLKKISTRTKEFFINLDQLLVIGMEIIN